MAKHKIMCGFELEMLLPKSMVNKFNANGVGLRKSFSQHSHQPASQLGWLKWTHEFGLFDPKPGRPVGPWSFNERNTYDGIEYSQVEIITMPLEISAALTQLQLLFSWMKDSKAITTKGCGLHVNLSFKDAKRTAKVDLFKLYEISETLNTLNQFQRQDNGYCKPYEKQHLYIDSVAETFANILAKKMNITTNGYGHRHRTTIKALHDVLTGDQISVAQMLTASIANEIQYSYDKDTALVPRHNEQKVPYFEFRSIGNVGYHTKQTQVLNAITKMVAALQVA